MEDHRTRRGVAQREKTRLTLMCAALTVFASKGPDQPVIDDFISAAAVARGTFYNYFSTTGELLAAVTGQMSDEVLCVVDPMVLQYDDPAMRICVGARLYMLMARRYPLWGEFLARIGSRHAVRGKLLDTYLFRDIQLGVQSRRFPVDNAVATKDIILGSMFYGIETMLTEPGLNSHAEAIMYSVLRGLGLSAREAHKIAFMPLAEPGPVPGPIFAQLALTDGK